MASAHAEAELEFRWAAMRAGFWLGWLSLAAVLVALSLGLAAQHRTHLVVLTAAAALAHAAAVAVPWRRWLGARRGVLLLDLWSAALIGFVTLLVVVAGARAGFDLLLFLVLPFIATAQAGGRRTLWLAVAAGGFALAMALAPDPLPVADVAMRSALLAAAVVLALMLARAVGRQASARAEADARLELEHALLGETHHRVKNSLQTIADLLLLARPAGEAGRPFDDTAGRIRTIGAVHRLLAEARGHSVGASALLERVAHAVDSTIAVEADPVQLAPAEAQQLGVVANELLANAVQHGRRPVIVRLDGGRPVRLIVDDAGDGCDGHVPGLGLELVEQVVAHGLKGRFTLGPRAGVGTRAEVAFDPGGADADPRR